jgi:hypothetical protein
MEKGFKSKIRKMQIQEGIPESVHLFLYFAPLQREPASDSHFPA